MDSAIVIKNLTKSFKNLKVLDGLNLEVERGTMMALLGPNGAGKTTTVRILSTLLKPNSGEALVNGADVIKNPDQVRAQIGLTGQYAAVDEYLTGRQNLEMLGRLYHLSTSDSKARAKELLEQFDLIEAGERIAKTYSGGMRRRLDLALSLIATPPVLFLDEPTTGLDPRSRLAMWEVIEKLVEADVTILLTTQYLEEADKLADKIAVLDHGRIITQGTSTELKEKVGKERLELKINKTQNFEKAVKVICGPNTSKQEQAKQALQTNEQERTISLPTGGTVSEIKRVLDKMQENNIEIETLSLHKPTLDDVFMRFTGHHVKNENGEETKKQEQNLGV